MAAMAPASAPTPGSRTVLKKLSAPRGGALGEPDQKVGVSVSEKNLSLDTFCNRGVSWFLD